MPNDKRIAKLKKLAPFLAGLCGLIIGIIFTSIFWYFYNAAVIKDISLQVRPIRQADNPYHYINPLLGYEVPGNIKEFDEYQPLKDAISNNINAQNFIGLQSYSVYFRDLTLGRWVGINENSSYAPASMMKVAIMIAFFKEAEINPSLLQQELQYSSSTADQINGVPFETPSNLQVGNYYTIQQLIQAMIISSDNGAKNVLLDHINEQDLNDIYTDLDLPNPDTTQNFLISPKQYSVMLRVLYNATYLSREYSEEALQIMSQAEYNQGLLAGLPSGTVVAQKFGENVDTTNPSSPIISLSNCGIVYQHTHPYILCIMTEGSSLSVLSQTIASISKTVWDNVNAYAQ
jgi:beta-lactamase class A